MPRNPTRKIINLALSEQVAKRIKAVPQRCFKNCKDAILSVPDLADGRYCEGYVCLEPEEGAIHEHAWIELKGQVIEPTLVLSDHLNRIGLPDHAYYSAAREWHKEDVAAHRKYRSLEPFYDLYDLTAVNKRPREYREILEAFVLIRVENQLEIQLELKQYVPPRLRKKVRFFRPVYNK